MAAPKIADRIHPGGFGGGDAGNRILEHDAVRWRRAKLCRRMQEQIGGGFSPLTMLDEKIRPSKCGKSPETPRERRIRATSDEDATQNGISVARSISAIPGVAATRLEMSSDILAESSGSASAGSRPPSVPVRVFRISACFRPSIF